jgi:hypothetical protein
MSDESQEREKAARKGGLLIALSVLGALALLVLLNMG